MRISFDLDDTLFVYHETHEVEKEMKFPFNLFFKDCLRKGAVDLIKRLKSQGHEIYIYTTSFRSLGYIKGYFRKYKIKLDGVINGAVHEAQVQKGRREIMPSKYPPRFRIDLHIDDEITVKQNGSRYGFRVMIIGERDSQWTEKIMKKVESLSC